MIFTRKLNRNGLGCIHKQTTTDAFHLCVQMFASQLLSTKQMIAVFCTKPLQFLCACWYATCGFQCGEWNRHFFMGNGKHFVSGSVLTYNICTYSYN